jgi:hypothetical protein
VPDLPPEWGAIVIPDDASELDQEAAELRREWRREARHKRWRRRLGLAAGRTPASPGALGLPLLIMSIALIATLTSLFALAWPSRPVQRSPSTGRAAQSGPANIADLTLFDADATPVRLRDSLPAVILLVDGCDCGALISATSAAAPAAVTVLAVGRTAPALPSAVPTGATPKGHRLRALADPGGLLSSYRSSNPGAVGPPGAAAILIRGTGQILRTMPSVGRVDDLRPQLDQLS